MDLPVRWRYKLDRWRSALAAKFRSQPKVQRPGLCPACGSLVGSTATKCHQCGASLTYSLAAASRSLSKYMPQTAPVTYGILALCCVLYIVGFLATINRSGFSSPGTGLGALFNLGGINSNILVRMGMSMPFDLVQPWRLVTAIFLHASLLHIGFNMWVLMDLGPTIEELYGSARFFFIFILTGVFGYVASSLTGHPSVGASGSLLGLVGLILALTKGRQSMGMQMLRGQAIYLLFYVVIVALLPGMGVDNYAHFGGFVSGFALGKLMVDRKPADASEFKRAQILGWAAGVVVAVSFAFMLLNYFSSSFGFS